MDRRSEALAQVLETALSERFATPVVELLGSLPLPLAVIHASDLRVVAANPAMHAVLRRSAQDAAGARLLDLVPVGHPLGDPAPLHAAAASNHPVSQQVTIDGEVREWFTRPLQGQNGEVDYLLIGLQAVPGNAGDEAVARLREANAAKTEFLNMAAHELRTPLAVILGYGSMLAHGDLSPDHQKLAGTRVYEKGKQLSKLITDLMLVARFDELGPELSRQDVDLAALVEEVVEDLRRRNPDLAIALTVDTAAAPFHGNRDWLQLAIRELLDNAARFRALPSGRIDVALTATADGVALTVVDDGLGIPEEDKGRLFRRFSRIETDATRHLVGLGIGLYLVLEVAHAHGGQVEVHSRAGQGSEFRLIVPRG